MVDCIYLGTVVTGTTMDVEYTSTAILVIIEVDPQVFIVMLMEDGRLMFQYAYVSCSQNFKIVQIHCIA